MDQQSVPWIGIYTKPTGSGDSGSWYKSRRNWVIPSAVTPTISNGDTVLLYMGDDPATVEPSIPHIALEIDSGSSNGDDAPEQELLLVALSTDSSAPVNNVEFTCKNFASNLEGESIDRVLD